MTRILALRCAFVGCAVAVLVLALLPAETQLLSTGGDKSNHFLAFGCLALLGGGGFPGRWLQVTVGLLAFGGLIEGLQWCTVDRVAEWADMFADAVGIAAGWLTCQLLARLPKHRLIVATFGEVWQ